MAQNTRQSDFQIIKLSAVLAKFAYTSGNPALEISKDNEAATSALQTELQPHITALGRPVDFQRYYSYSWFIPKSRQPEWFRSYAYFCHFKGPGGSEERSDQNAGAGEKQGIDRIIVGFRGTWNDSTGSGEWFRKSEALPKSWSLRAWITDKLTPSSKYGLSDFYYDAMVIRIPYRKGTVWKWWAYWGSLILERTNWARRLFAWPRAVAGDWMKAPNKTLNEPNGGKVHLGFWSLWAAPEGFAGYDRDGNVSSEESVLHSVRKALEKTNGRETHVYVVGHSLGGAVSSFAALDIAEELKKYPNAIMHHVTFGSPPVGTAAFAEYFKQQMSHHQSWCVSHERDLIPQCFSWCASKSYLQRLGWWSDWSRVGEQRFITRLESREPSIANKGNDEIGIFEKCKWAAAGLGALTVLYGLSLLAIPVSGACYFGNFRRYKSKENPPKGLESARDKTSDKTDAKIATAMEEVGLEYHSLQRYIELLQNEDDLKSLINDGTRDPARALD